MTEIKKRVKKNYVNNADFLEALIKYKQACKEAEESGDPLPRVPNYIGECIYKIANRLAGKPNFANYSFREDMVMDGIETSLKYMHNFDPLKSNNPNPFAYFTMIIWNAFIQRIAKEKKQMYIRYKSSQDLISMGSTYDGGSEDISIYLNTGADYINGFIEDYESKFAKKGKEKLEEVLVEVILDDVEVVIGDE